MYLVDTNVVSESRKRGAANPGVSDFYRRVISTGEQVYVSVITVGELRRGVDLIRHRGDVRQASHLEAWLTLILEEFAENILPFAAEAAQIWGRLRVPHPEHELDKQIAATALLYDLTVVTRNTSDFADTGARLLNPFR